MDVHDECDVAFDELLLNRLGELLAVLEDLLNFVDGEVGLVIRILNEAADEEVAAKSRHRGDGRNVFLGLVIHLVVDGFGLALIGADKQQGKLQGKGFVLKVLAQPFLRLNCLIEDCDGFAGIVLADETINGDQIQSIGEVGDFIIYRGNKGLSAFEGDSVGKKHVVVGYFVDLLGEDDCEIAVGDGV